MKRLRVLIVEDSEDDARLIMRQLERGGYEPLVERVETAEQMTAALDRGDWDVVISDHALPAFDSSGALALLKQRDLDVPFLIVSGAITEEAAVAAMRAGAHDFISKNASARLVPAVDRELRELAERREAQAAKRRRQREAEALAVIARETAEDLGLPVLTQRIADRVLELFGATTAAVRLKDASGRLVSIAFAGAAAADPGPGYAITLGAGVVGRAAAEGRVVWTADLLNDPELELPRESQRYHAALAHRALLAAPLRAGGETLGTLSIGDARVRSFTEDEVRLFEALADHAALAVRNGQLLAREQAARAEAEALNRAKDEFLAMLAHELRNPLAAIASAIGVLDKIAQADTLASRSRHIIRRQTQHLKRLVDDLLDAARVTMGKIALSVEPIDLGDAVRACLAHLEASRLDQYRLETAVESVWVRADPTRLEQIGVNLLDNAMKHTPPGGTIHVEVRREGDHGLFTVEDTGLGIAADLLPRVFDLFTQGARGLDRTQGGLGIGLTLVRRLVELHGGSVEASSPGAGRGSRFVIRLPLLGAPAMVAERPGGQGPVGGRRGRRILLVEDNADTREMLRTFLELGGHEVHETPDAPAALAAVPRVKPDIALVDIGLPGMDGYGLAERLRAEHGRLPLVALTGYGQPEDRERALRAGFDAHLVKPVEPETLERLLTEFE